MSEREKEALRLLFFGHDAKSIARDLGLSIHTVNDRLRDARRKLEVSSSREAARRLVDAEGGYPKIHVPMQSGLATPLARSPGAMVTEPVLSWGRPLAWLGGGMLVMSLIVVAAAFLSLADSASPPAAGVAPPMAAVGSRGEADAAGAAAARAWLALVDAGRWPESWADAGTLFRTQLSAAGWQAAIIPVRKPLGIVQGRAFRGVTGATALPGAPAGQYQVIEFTTDFASRHGAVETVVLAREPSGWKVDGYFIR